MRVITAHYSLMDKQIAESLVHFWKEESIKLMMAAERKMENSHSKSVINFKQKNTLKVSL